jgi:hypothetical protein
MILEKELQTYSDRLPDLLCDEGKFVLIKGDDVVGVWETYADALKEGYQKFQLEPFMVKRIEAVERVQRFTRGLTGCPQ